MVEMARRDLKLFMLEMAGKDKDSAQESFGHLIIIRQLLFIHLVVLELTVFRVLLILEMVVAEQVILVLQYIMVVLALS